MRSDLTAQEIQLWMLDCMFFSEERWSLELMNFLQRKAGFQMSSVQYQFIRLVVVTPSSHIS